MRFCPSRRDIIFLLQSCSLVPRCFPNFSWCIQPDKVQTRTPASFLMVGLVFGMGTSEAEGMLTSVITASLHPPEICLLKPCIVLIKVSAVLIKLVPVALLCLKLHARQWSCCTSCGSPRESWRRSGASQFLYCDSFRVPPWDASADNICHGAALSASGWFALGHMLKCKEMC